MCFFNKCRIWKKKKKRIILHLSVSIFFFSLKGNYGRVFSMKVGSYKFVMASTPDAVKEVLVKKSADYAGRQQEHATLEASLGRLL